MNYIRSIQNLVLGKIIEYQEKNAFVLNKPSGRKTYIMVIDGPSVVSEKIVKANLGNAHYLCDGTFAEQSEKNNFLINIHRKNNDVNLVPFLVALKSDKEILPVYVADDLSTIGYGNPFYVSDGYHTNGQFDFEKINGYVDMWKSSIEEVKKKVKR